MEGTRKRLRIFESVLNLKPDSEDGLIKKGQSLGFLEEPERALECFEVALKINPDNLEALNYKGVALKHMGKL